MDPHTEPERAKAAWCGPARTLYSLPGAPPIDWNRLHHPWRWRRNPIRRFRQWARYRRLCRAARA